MWMSNGQFFFFSFLLFFFFGGGGRRGFEIHGVRNWAISFGLGSGLSELGFFFGGGGVFSFFLFSRWRGFRFGVCFFRLVFLLILLVETWTYEMCLFYFFPLFIYT